ncbi:MAG: GNAT family N-acetyltransferase [Myxococcota bacterium]|nr:GNAT family N-acetyltransferase [Myxococcota bacterium]
MPIPESFHTARLEAERLRPEHLASLQAFHRDPEMMRGLGGVRSEAETARYLRRNLDHWANHGFGVWMLRTRGGDEPIGRVVLRWLSTESVDDVEIGFAFLPSHWGQGFATEAARYCVELAKTELDLHTLIGITTPPNHASQRVLTKLGFAHERDTVVEGTRCLLFRSIPLELVVTRAERAHPSHAEAEMNPHDRWRETWERVGRTPPDGVLEDLVRAYEEPHRAYHTLQHLEECFSGLASSPVAPEDAGALELAIWFHDAIYDTRASDNEARSAAWARSALASLPSPALDRIEALIGVTQHEAEPSTPDEALLLDIDLSILGAAPARFSQYESQIRREYDWVPEAAYRRARARVLGQFQERPVLYHTPWFRGALEARARENLGRSLESLAAEELPEE